MKKIFWILLILTPFIIVGVAVQTDSSSDGTPPPPPEKQPPVETSSANPEPEPVPEVVKGSGEFYFRVKFRDWVYDAATFKAEVRTFPADGAWPGVDTEDDGTTHKNDVYAILKIDGIHVPQSAPDYTRWHAAVEREETRYDESTTHVWKLLSSAETGIIKAPIAINGIVSGQIFIMTGGNRIDLGKALVYDGFAADYPRDWGKR